MAVELFRKTFTFGERLSDLKSDSFDRRLFIQQMISEISDSIDVELKRTTTHQIFNDSFIEFLKNSIDANATQVTVIYIVKDFAKRTYEIKCVDNGTAPLKQSLIGAYQWREAVNSVSDKKKGTCLGGRNLGLALCAYRLERYGAGTLFIKPNSVGGVEISLTSSTPTLKEEHYVIEEGVDYQVELRRYADNGWDTSVDKEQVNFFMFFNPTPALTRRNSSVPQTKEEFGLSTNLDSISYMSMNF